MSQKEARNAIRRGLNDSIRQGRTASRKAIRDRYNIPLNQLTGTGKDRLTKIDWAKVNNLQTGLNANVRKSVKLAKFNGTSGGGGTIKRTKSGTVLRRGGKNLSQPLTGKKKRLVTVKLLKGGTKKTIDQAFVVKTKSGHIGVFGRGKYDGTGAFKFADKGGRMQELGSTTLYKAMSSRKVEREIVNKMKEALPRRTKFWLQRQLKLV